MTSERMASSLARPPAFRITCASPSPSPAYFAGSSRASMQVRMANPRAGGRARSALSPNPSAYASLACRTSLRTDKRTSCSRGLGNGGATAATLPDPPRFSQQRRV